MYESHFGLTGQPFRLSPDPAFYFASQGHDEASSRLRTGLAADCGVSVLTGDIGAGKTTLVKTVVAELDAGAVEVATLSSTQLDGHELIVAALIGFGVPFSLAAEVSPINLLLRFLFHLDKSNRRAVLVIDEAQNLPLEAFVALATVATRRQPRPVPLHLVFVGQPELRDKLEAPELRPLRQAITSRCHLGPLRIDEVGDYVLHRLRRAGWNGNPAFDSDAFEEVFRWTQGVPRRINLLLNRLLVAQFLAAANRIDGRAVRGAARESHAEFARADEQDGPAPMPVAGSGAATRWPADASAVEAPRSAGDVGSILCVASSRDDHVKAAMLLRALAAHPCLPSARLLRIGASDALALTLPLFATDAVARTIELELRHSLDDGTRLVELATALQHLLERHLPAAIVVFAGDAPAHAAAAVAHAMEIPVWQADAGRRRVDEPDSCRALAAQTDRAAALLFTADAQATQVLVDEKFSPGRILCVGSLLADAVAATPALAEWLPGGSRHAGVRRLLLSQRHGYGLLVLRDPPDVTDRRSLRARLDMLKLLSRDIVLLCPMSQRLEACLARHRLADYFEGTRLVGLASTVYPEYLQLLRGASCVLTDAPGAQEEATVLAVPCLTLATGAELEVTVSAGSNTVVGPDAGRATRLIWECIYGGGKRGRRPALWDGNAAAKIASVLASAQWPVIGSPVRPNTLSEGVCEPPFMGGYPLTHV